jgi:WD repeat-containing protein 7
VSYLFQLVVDDTLMRRSTLELCARWTAFSTPLLSVIDCEQDPSALLHGCVLCIATDGTIAVIVVDGFQL